MSSTLKRVAGSAVMGAAVALTNAFVPGTAEAHCGHGCPERYDYTGSYCDQTDCNYYAVGKLMEQYDHLVQNMLGTKNDFQGCDPDWGHACVGYYETWVGDCPCD
jgi:hypothetical protein